jgi:hypothetical protein
MQTAKRASIELHRCLLIVLRIGGAIGLMLLKNLLHRRRKTLSIDLHIREPARKRKGRTGKNETGKPVRFGECIVNGEHASPGMPKEMHLLKAERVPDLLKLFDKTASLPERGVVWSL